MGTKFYMCKDRVLLIAFILVAILSTFIFLKSTYSERKIAVDTPLIEPIRSLMTPEVVQELLQSKNYKFVVVENSALPEGDKRPSFEILTWQIENFEHLGVRGTLVLTFFNSQMMKSRFYPHDYEQYRRVLSEQHGSDVTVGIPLNLSPKTVLQQNKDHSGNIYFEWLDKELDQQVIEWIRSYS